MEATPNPAKGANDAIDGLTFVAWPSSTATRLGVVDGLTFVAGGCHEAKTREATCDGAREAVRHLPHRRWEGFGVLRGVDSGLDHLQKRLEIGVLGFTGGMGGLALRLPLVCRSHARLVLATSGEKCRCTLCVRTRAQELNGCAHSAVDWHMDWCPIFLLASAPATMGKEAATRDPPPLSPRFPKWAPKWARPPLPSSAWAWGSGLLGG